MFAGILAEIDQAEVDRLPERVARARHQRVEAGHHGGGKRPFGMQLDGTLIPDEVDAVRDSAQ